MPSVLDDAQAELDSIEAKYSMEGSRLNLNSRDRRRWTVTFPNGLKKGYMVHINQRKREIRAWIKKWGHPLKIIGYQVGVCTEMFPYVQPMSIRQEKAMAAQIEKEKLEKFSDPKRQRSKRLRKRLEE